MKNEIKIKIECKVKSVFELWQPMVLAPLAVLQGDVMGGFGGLGCCFQQLEESNLLLLSAFLDWFRLVWLVISYLV